MKKLEPENKNIKIMKWSILSWMPDGIYKIKMKNKKEKHGKCFFNFRENTNII